MDQLETENTDVGDWTVERHVTALYQAHALSLARLALVMLGDRRRAQDVVQDAFLGLYRRWDGLADPRRRPAYLRTSVLNGCRTALRRRARYGVVSTAPSREAAPDRRWSPPRPPWCTARNTARCWPRSGGSPPASARRSCSATTST